MIVRTEPTLDLFEGQVAYITLRGKEYLLSQRRHPEFWLALVIATSHV